MKPTETSLPPEKKLTQNVEIGTLSAFYGGLLTEHQRMALQLHYDDDWSLAEVADHLGVSRQNVHDLITRSAQKLYRYEKAVGGVAQANRISVQLLDAEAELVRAEERMAAPEREAVAKALQLIRQIITDLNEE